MPLSDSVGFSSPAALSRIMSLYSGRGHASRMQKETQDIVREALNTDEGLKMAQLDESSSIKKLTREGWDATTSREQRETQLESVRFQDDLRPIPYLLRTKRSKRCPVRPASSASTTRP